MKRNCKKWYTLKSAALIFALLIVAGVFSACGKPDKEDIARDLSENVTSDSAAEIPKSLSYTIEGSSTIKVDAEVYSEGYGQVPTYKLKQKEKNDEWVKSYAEKLFDNGEYINVKPYNFCSTEELETEKQFWEELLMTLDESSSGYRHVQSEIDFTKYAMEDFFESNYVQYKSTDEGQLIFTESYSCDEGLLPGYAERARLRGKVDGNVWLLEYDNSVYEVEEGNWSANVPGLYGTCVEKADYISSENEGIYENKCDRAEAEREAAKLLDRLGFNNMECVKVSELCPRLLREQPNDLDGIFKDADYFDGYCITYGPSLNGIKMYSDIGVAVSADGEHFAIQPYVSILVNSEGAYSFCIMEDYGIEEKLSENSQMLSFQQIEDIAHTELKKDMEGRSDMDMNITQVKFEYLCVTYDGIDYAMIPVWTYYTEWVHYSYTHTTPWLTINALDGAVISRNWIGFEWEYDCAKDLY